MPKSTGSSSAASSNGTIKLGDYLKKYTIYTSRKKIKKLLRAKRVFINGQITTNISRKISLNDFKITILDDSISEENIDDQTLNEIKLPTILVLNKPCNVLTTLSDELKSRVCVNNFFPEKILKMGLHPIGRLDQHSTGLLLFTTDGKLTQYLLNPKNHVPREYCCIVQGIVNFESLKLKLKNGVETRWGTFHGKLLESKHIKNLKNDEEINLHENFQQHLVHCCCKQQKNELLFTRQDGPNPFPSSPIIDKSTLSMIKISVSEGKKRMIRRMLAYSGFPVLNLFRYKFGEIELGNLNDNNNNLNHYNDDQHEEKEEFMEPGKYRNLTIDEGEWIKSLYRRM